MEGEVKAEHHEAREEAHTKDVSGVGECAWLGKEENKLKQKITALRTEQITTLITTLLRLSIIKKVLLVPKC